MNYQKDSLRTESNDFEAIKGRLDDSKIRLLHAAIGMQTESAEFTDMLKKHLFYGKKLDTVNLAEEVGDLFWYMAVALDTLGYSFEEVMETNLNKLKARFPDKFTEFCAENRDISTERKILENKK